MAVRVAVMDTSLDVTFTGWDLVWVLSTGVSVPLDQIVSVRMVNRVSALARLRWRLGGTSWPGVVCAGHFSLHSRNGRALVRVYRAPAVLEVTTRLWRPHLLLLQCDDAEAVAERLTALIARAADGAAGTSGTHGDSVDGVQ